MPPKSPANEIYAGVGKQRNEIGEIRNLWQIYDVNEMAEEKIRR